MEKRVKIADYKAWEAHIAGWELSGQTQKTFCHEQGLNLNNFVYWRARLKKTASTEKKQESVSRSFISMIPPLPNAGHATAEIVLSQGTRIVCPIAHFFELAQHLIGLNLL